jgi:hypothetical protein
MVKIMFEDLTYEAQVRLLSEAGVSSPKEMKWHILPVAIVEFEKKNPALREEDFGGVVYNGDYDGYLY